MAALAPLMLITAAAGTAVTAIGTIASGRAADEIGRAEQQRLQMQGQNAKTASEFEAKQLEIQGRDEFAAGQREAQQFKRQKQLALSSLTTRSAASGFSATDPTTLALGDEIEKYGTLQEGLALYGGSARQRDLNLSASARRFSGDSAYQSAYASGDIAAAEGRAKRNASYLSAAGSILGGVSTMASRFGGTAPRTMGRYDSGSAYNPARIGSIY